MTPDIMRPAKAAVRIAMVLVASILFVYTPFEFPSGTATLLVFLLADGESRRGSRSRRDGDLVHGGRAGSVQAWKNSGAFAIGELACLDSNWRLLWVGLFDGRKGPSQEN